MPDCAFVTRELASLLGVLANAERIRIIQELRGRELDVNSLQKVLGVSHSRVSQNLAILRSHRIVTERREGRHVFYHLVQPRMAAWLLEGLEFLEREAVLGDEIRSALGRARASWSGSTEQAADAAPAAAEDLSPAKPLT